MLQLCHWAFILPIQPQEMCDRTDTEMCEIFGVPVEQSEEENSDINEDN